MKSAHRFMMLALAVLVPGCYRYTPVDSPQPGMEVRARLNAEAAARRSQGFDEPILSYDGVIVDTTPESVSLNVLIARSSTMFQDVEIRDTVRIETSELQSLMEREIAPLRTALVGVGIGVGAFAVVKSIDAVVGGTGDDDDGNGPPPQNILVPVLSWTGSSLVPALFGRRHE